MSKLNELIAQLCPDGVEYISLGDLFNTRNGYTPSKSKAEYWENGTIPWFRMEDIRENGRILSDASQHVSVTAVKGSLFPENSIIVATSATIGEHALITVPSLANQRFTYLILKEAYKDKFDIMFLYYYCFKLDSYCKECLNQGNFASVDMRKFVMFQFPIPPIEVQREIVRILDNFTELTAELTTELTTELTARQQQYDYYRNDLLVFDDNVPVCRLEDIADIGTGSSNTNEGLEEGEYPFFVRSPEVLRKNEYEFDETAIITAGDGVGVGKVFHYVDGKYALHQRAYRIHINAPNVLPRFFLHYMRATFVPYIQKNMYQGAVASIRRPMLNAYPVPVPPVVEQKRIVNILDRFDVVYNDIMQGLPAEIEARQKQYEYYRDKLLTFPEYSA